MDIEFQTQLYTWKPISSHDSIRLLILHPSQEGSSNIHITLTETRLSNCPEFEALSYCWATEDGDNSRSRVIYCDGAKFLVTSTCDAALRRLRKDVHRVLWIDAICINQADDDERSRQVNQMGSIYKTASSVKIYLGEPSSEIEPEIGNRISDTTVDSLAAFYVELKALRASSLSKINPDNHSPLYRGLAAVLYSASREDLASIPGLRGLRDILRRRWWTRVWVVQEAILAKECAILWGQKLIPYSHICLFYSVTKWSGHSFHDFIWKCKRCVGVKAAGMTNMTSYLA